ncbi:MAG: FISUMP domain-containing protein [Bacteroidales bacterium]|nr:FISUMP domain-containing protein [Bacteroidales bacterium]
MNRAILTLAGLIIISNLQAQTVTDIDGNVYPTVNIGTQVWMAENLKTTRFNDGTNIPMEMDSTAWNHLSYPAYCWYSNASVYKDIFGALYNWLAVGAGKLAPTGWHVATDAEWTILTNLLGGAGSAGGKLKTVGTIEVGTSYWYTPNTGATNASGFSGLPGGAREFDGSYNYLFSYGFWWTATNDNSGFAYYRNLSYNYADVQRGLLNYQDGLSVRCVKDPPSGIDINKDAQLLNLFPNPAFDHIIIDITTSQKINISIYSLTGKLLVQQMVDGRKNEIDVSALSKGIYIIHVTGTDWKAQRKLIK